MKKQLFFCCIVIFSIINLFAESNEFPKLTGPYLGQKPPGTTPEIFAPDIVSIPNFHDFKAAFSPDGKEFYFCRHNLPDAIPSLYFSKLSDGVWTEPNELDIAKGAMTFHPSVTFDNKWLLFFWKFDEGNKKKSGYYVSSRTGNDWSPPQYAGEGMAATVDKKGNIYAQEIVVGDRPGFFMNRITFADGSFKQYKRIDIQQHYGQQTHPCISPDGSFLVFDIQDRVSRMFVCFQDSETSWGEPIDMTDHGIMKDARNAYVSPDGKYLFFSYNGDIWWVSAKIIEELRPKTLK